MKRDRKPSVPAREALRPLTQAQLARARGGATAIEYGLIAAVAPEPTSVPALKLPPHAG